MKQTMTRRYYSTHSAVRYPPILQTLSEAIEEGKRKLNDPDCKIKDEIYIVEIVKVIRVVEDKNELPIEVIEIRK